MMPTPTTAARGGRRWAGRPLAAVALVVALAAALAGLHRLWLPQVAHALAAGESPRPSDAILVLGGGYGERLDRALELYREGQAPLLVTSGEPPALPDFERPFAELAAGYLVARGVPPEAILTLPETTSTRDEAVQSLSLARERSWRSVLVVTAEHHCLRARLTFRKVYRGSGVEVAVVAARGDWFDPRTWWRSERSLLDVSQEYQKLAYYLLKGYLF